MTTAIVRLDPGADTQTQHDDLMRLLGYEAESKTDKHILSQFRVSRFYGCSTWFALHQGVVVSAHASRFGLQRRNAWGRYLNWHSAYTRPEYRRRGFARALWEEVELQARRVGVDRVKSLAGSWLGLQLHLGLGHQCWGMRVSGEMLVDSPLDPAATFPDSLPHAVRGLPGARLLTPDEARALWVTVHPLDAGA